MADDISICAQALILVGADEITSFEDETREAKVCAAIYTDTKQASLQAYPWKFATKQVQLARLSAAPLYKYGYAFQLPADCLIPISIESDSPYEIFQSKLYSDDKAVNLKYIANIDENDFPPYFIKVLVYELAALLALSLAEDESKSAVYVSMANSAMMRARKIDSQQQPNGQMRQGNFLLTQVRL